MKTINRILLVLSLIVLFASGYTSNNTIKLIHEWAGIVFIVVVLLHLILNRQWFKTLLKGKYNTNRFVILVVDLALIILLILITLSSIVISRYLLRFMNCHILSSVLARRFHLSLTAWLFVICGFHNGLHVNTSKMNKITIILNYIFVIIGALIFINFKFYNDLFLVNEYPSPPLKGFGKLFILYLLFFMAYTSLGILYSYYRRPKKQEVK